MNTKRNTVHRVNAPDTTEGTKRRNAEIAAEATAREKAEIEYYRSMMDPNNRSAEAMAMRDGPVESLTPDVVEMIALGKPMEWALKAASPYVKSFAGAIRKLAKAKTSTPQKTLDEVFNSIPSFRSVSATDEAGFNAIKEKIADWYLKREGVINEAAKNTGVPDSVKGYVDGVKNARLIDTSGFETRLPALRTGNAEHSEDLLGFYRASGGLRESSGEVALASKLSKANRDTVYHEVGAHGASHGARVEAITSAEKRAADARMKHMEALDAPNWNPDSLSYKVVKSESEVAHDNLMRTYDSLSSAEETIKILQKKHGIKVSDPSYWDSPKETFGGLWSTRANAGVDPTFKWTPEFVKELRAKGGIIDEARLGKWSDEALSEMANKVPAIAVPVAVGTEARQDAKGGNAADVRAATKATGKPKAKWSWDTYRWNPDAPGGSRIDPKDIKGTGISFDSAKDRMKVPKGREKEFERYMDALANPPPTVKLRDGREVPVKSFLVPKDWRTRNDYNRDYDYVAAFLAGATTGPVDHGAEGYFLHLNDVGKMPSHPTFSKDSYYARDPRYSKLAGVWKGETYIPGEAERSVRQDAKGGDGGNGTQGEAPVQGTAAQVSDGGPRIVINPSTFRNEKDALCVAYNEALRIVMEENGFDPVSEPTDAQREFFADTAYADDELMLRRTILARICVFDTSVKDPTDEQLEEAVEFLETVMEIGAPQNSEEQSVVQRAHDVIARTLQARPRGREAGEAAGTPGSRGDTGQAPASSGSPTEEGLSETRTTSGTPGTGEPGAPGTPDAGT